MDYSPNKQNSAAASTAFDKLFVAYLQRVGQHYEADKAVQLAVRKLQTHASKHR